MSHRQDYEDVAHLPLPERVARLRALFLRDRQDGRQRSVEDYVRQVPEGERPLLLDELREAQRHLDDGATTGSAPSGHDAGPAPGHIGRYQIQSLLGRGGFGEVWRAFDPELRRAVAVKLLRSDRQWSDEQVALFLEEGRKLARLKHPGIVAVYDVGQAGGGLFIVSELIEGGTLEQRIARGKMATQDIPSLLAEVADAANHAHLHGLIHRDIKPANVLMDSQHRPHLADFGVALAEEEQLGAKGSVAGTLAYMSPEQVRGESHLLDGRTDVYSIGVVMYELLTGRRPFQGKNREEYREQILLRHPRPPRSIDDSIPRVLEAICLKCLAKAVGDRYATAADLAEDLRCADAKGAAPAESTATLRTGGPRRRWLWAAGAGLLVLASGLGLALSGRLWPNHQGGLGLVDVAEQPGRTEDSAEILRIKELVWPGNRPNDRSNWRLLEPANSLTVYSTSFSLLKLADLTRDDFDVSMEFRQLNRTGQIGVFFGCREDRVRGVTTYQALQVVVLGKDSAHLQRTSNTFRSKSPLDGHSGPTLGSASIEYPPSRDHTMTFRVRGGRLTQVTFNTKPIAGLTNPGTALFDCRGAFGVYNVQSEGTFSRVVIDNAPKTLRGPNH